MDRARPENDDLALGADILPKAGESPTGVRRVNNMPLLIIGGVLLIFVVLVAMVAAQRGEKKPIVEASSASLPESSRLLDQMLASTAVGGLVGDPDDNTPVASFPVARVADPDAPPQPDRAGGAKATDDTVANERMKLFQTAMHAKTALAKAAPNEGKPAGPAAASAAGADESRLPTAPTPPDTRVPVHANGDYEKFAGADARQKGADRWLLGNSVEAPRTAFEIRAGSVIPATMISGINSDLPGQIIAQVSQDVFDTPTGRHRLIPQGSRLVGRYNHNVVDGQSRLLVAWQRIVFPDGKALDIGAMEGVDSAGYAGFGDKVDRHYLRLFGSAILMSGITAGLTSSRVGPDQDPFGSSNAAQLSQALAQQIGEVASQMIKKNMSYAPTLMIRPGYRFNVMAVKDLTFNGPYQAFDY
ncbi:MAG TPA: TrbI/VirB10 family protein [Luteibacter sp.]|uniref:TrbI/VirB10 family protein n=1 Tax=Luteibacter sp. TaxID=1886636 RepID=UPI002BDC9D9D|nr:TrbI/VirB10 family protein [Luteibacter sp.]HVI56681.1 TrbI/VirB10 family protein [Luteibacter sp.]